MLLRRCRTGTGKIIVATLLCILIEPMSGYVLAAERITGVYSDMEFNEEAGDVIGIEIFLVYSREGFQAIFQDAEGSPSVPVVVPAIVKGSEITFELPERNGYSGKFLGRIQKDRIEGHFLTGAAGREGEPEIVLKRGRSYWQ